VLVRLGAALAAIVSAASLRALGSGAGGEPEVVSTLETALASLAQLAGGARGRLDPDRTYAGPPGTSRPLTVAVARVLSGSDASLAKAAVVAALETLLAGVPSSIGMLASAIVLPIAALPIEGSASDAPLSRVAEVLPAWLTPRRTIGGFYVLRALNAGAAGSVFVATRLDERTDEAAERYALKVPEYSATVARSLSEADFMKMFRQEAAALLALPTHPNLARFVLFDDASKPKPILVMELVEGTPFDRLVEAQGLDTARVLEILDGVLCGLTAMHDVGVGHLDVKPSNVVLRRAGQPVLVDFGLAGRHIRPGCATGPYGAPEVWGALDGHRDSPPEKADVYAFACVAFEALTGRLLFDAPSEMGQIALHLSHDGFPDPLMALAAHPEALGAGGRGAGGASRSPRFAARPGRSRPTAATLRKELSRLAPGLSKRPWPIDAS
jgi:hypothetical protein